MSHGRMSLSITALSIMALYPNFIHCSDTQLNNTQYSTLIVTLSITSPGVMTLN